MRVFLVPNFFTSLEFAACDSYVMIMMYSAVKTVLDRLARFFFQSDKIIHLNGLQILNSNNTYAIIL